MSRVIYGPLFLELSFAKFAGKGVLICKFIAVDVMVQTFGIDVIDVWGDIGLNVTNTLLYIV